MIFFVLALCTRSKDLHSFNTDTCLIFRSWRFYGISNILSSLCTFFKKFEKASARMIQCITVSSSPLDTATISLMLNSQHVASASFANLIVDRLFIVLRSARMQKSSLSHLRIFLESPPSF